MKNSHQNMTFEEIENEASSENSFGYFWTTLVEDVVAYVCKNKSFPPQSWGYSGHGQSELEWSEADLIELADWVIHEKIKKHNQHLTILYQVKDRDVASIFRLLVQPVTWAIKDKRLNSVDGNAVRLIKEILKDEHDIVLKMTTPTSDPTFETTIDKLVVELKKVPQHWDHSSSLTRRGTPRKNLPPVFRKTELGQICDQIVGMKPIPASNQIWRAVQSVLPAREGTQAGQKKLAGAEYLLSLTQMDSDDPFTKIASEHIGDSQVSDSALEIGSEDGLNVELIQAATVFRQILTGEEEVAMKVVLHPEFSHLPLQQKAQALEVTNAGEIEKILKSLMSKSKKIASDFELDSEEMNQITVFSGRALMRDGEIW